MTDLHLPLLTTMSVVLPGEEVPAQHVNLKLGPGLLQVPGVGRESTVISTRAGILNHSANRSKWWVESNSRRVRFLQVCFQKKGRLIEDLVVRSSTSGVGRRGDYTEAGRRIPC